jgi:hypothetical protein
LYHYFLYVYYVMIDNPLPSMIRLTTVNGIRVGIVESMVGESNDCAIRALVASTGSTYDEARKFIGRETGRKPRQGTETASLIRALDGKSVLGKSFKGIGDRVTEVRGYVGRVRVLSPSVRTKRGGMIVKSPMTVMRFLKEYSKGTYYILTINHAMAIIDGVIYGNPEDGQRLKARVMGAFVVS